MPESRPAGEPGPPGTTTWAGITDKPDVTPFLLNGSIVQRDSNGRSYINSPNSNFDIANKGYVDAEVGKKADTSHKHTMSDISDLPGCAYDNKGNSLVLRDGSGAANISAPQYPMHITNKQYVDNAIAGCASKGDLQSLIRLVDSPPSSPTSGVLYVIPEA